MVATVVVWFWLVYWLSLASWLAVTTMRVRHHSPPQVPVPVPSVPRLQCESRLQAQEWLLAQGPIPRRESAPLPESHQHRRVTRCTSRPRLPSSSPTETRDEMTRRPVANPGSDDARKQGCSCAVLDNNHGKYPPFPPDGWWITGGCPVHAPEADADDDNG